MVAKYRNAIRYVEDLEDTLTKVAAALGVTEKNPEALIAKAIEAGRHLRVYNGCPDCINLAVYDNEVATEGTNMKTICPNCGAPDSVSALAHDGEQWWNTKCPTCQKPYAWHDDGRSKKMHASSHPEFADFRAALTAWAVARWKDEVANRPLVNTHRRTLDDTWRQVIRFGGGDPDALVGPSHDVLVGESKPGRWCSCVECIGYQPEPTDEQDALQSLYEVVIAQNRAGADWGDRFGAMMTALAKASKFVKPQPPQGYCRRDDICECSPEVRSTCGNWRPLLADVQPKDERELMRDILPALRVLRTVLESAGLAFGAAKASELITDIERSVK